MHWPSILRLILCWNHFPFSGSRCIGIKPLVQAHLVLDNSTATVNRRKHGTLRGTAALGHGLYEPSQMNLLSPLCAFLFAQPSLNDRIMNGLFDDTFSGIYRLSFFDWTLLIPYFGILAIL